MQMIWFDCWATYQKKCSAGQGHRVWLGKLTELT